MNERQKVLAETARRLDRAICERLAAMERSKVEVFLLLSDFKRQKLYRHLEMPMSAGHAARLSGRGEICAATDEICARRRFTTWEDYLASLGRHGISFGYFAELERLEALFGRGFMVLCAAGIPVAVRRVLLRLCRTTPAAAERIREIVASRASEAEKIALIICEAEGLERGEEPPLPQPGYGETDDARVSRYRRHVCEWERKLLRITGRLEATPRELWLPTVRSNIVHAWREVFDRHLEAGERLAGLELLPGMGAAEGAFLRRMRTEWTETTRGLGPPRMRERAP